MANPEVVKALMEHLVAAFEQFADQKADESERGLEFIDALMGFHNAYKAVILDMERRIDDSRFDIRQTAINTLTEALQR